MRNYSVEKNILINNNKLQIDEIKKQCEVSIDVYICIVVLV